MAQIKRLREKNQKYHERVSITFKAYIYLLNIYTNALKIVNYHDMYTRKVPSLVLGNDQFTI